MHGDADGDDISLNEGNDIGWGGDGDDQIRGTAGNDTLYGEAGNDYVQGGDGNDMVYGGDGTTTSTAGWATTSSTAAVATTTSRPMRVTTSSMSAVGVNDVYGETGADTIYVLEDGIRDEFYCGPAASGEPGDHIVFVGRPTGQDHINGCDRKLDAFVADGSPEYTALLPYFGPTPPGSARVVANRWVTNP